MIRQLTFCLKIIRIIDKVNTLSLIQYLQEEYDVTQQKTLYVTVIYRRDDTTLLARYQ